MRVSLQSFPAPTNAPSMPTLPLPGLSGQGTMGSNETGELMRSAVHQVEAESLRPMPPMVAGFVSGFETGSIRRGMPLPPVAMNGSLRRMPNKPAPPASNYDAPSVLAASLLRAPAPPGGRPLVDSLRRVQPPPPDAPPPPSSSYDAAPSLN
jgi:hypothetical protein